MRTSLAGMKPENHEHRQSSPISKTKADTLAKLELRQMGFDPEDFQPSGRTGDDDTEESEQPYIMKNTRIQSAKPSFTFELISIKRILLVIMSASSSLRLTWIG